MVQASQLTPEEYKIVKRLYGQKATMSAIGDAIGKSRSAAAGIIGRLRAKNDPAFAPYLKRGFVVNASLSGIQPKKAYTAVNVQAVNKAKDTAPPKHRFRLRLIENSQAVTINELQPHHCLYPSGDPRLSDFRYCGCTKLEGRPYCAEHCQIAFQPPAQRQPPKWR